MPNEHHADLAAGARMAMAVCMGVTSADRVYVVTDEATRSIGEALRAAAAAKGAGTRIAVLEDFGARPMTVVSPAFARAVAAFAPTVTVYAAQGQPGELPFRSEMRRLFAERNTRHAHMPGIDARCMREGMAADYRQVAALTQRVYARVKDARQIEASNPDGTRLAVTCDPARLRWAPFDGMYHKPGRWGNLPEGETFTAPAGVEGVIVSYVLGDYFSGKYGLLPSPVTVRIRAGHAEEVSCTDAALQAELWEYLHQDPQGTRVGEFAIGTNTYLTALSGNLLQDEKIPGVHIAFGNPYPSITGADWHARTHIDLVAPNARIVVDGETIMERGQFAPGLLA